MLKTNVEERSSQVSGKQPLRVCIQGGAGAFHEIAARYCFDEQTIEIVPADTFEELIQKVEEQKEADLGLMAIENTLAGSLMSNYELLRQSELWVAGEVFLRIRQNLMVYPGQRIEDLREVHSHPIAIAQCREFFQNYPQIRLVERDDTALSAMRVKKNELRHVGAIASTLAADLYELQIIASSIETNKKNHTRFWVLDQKENHPVIDSPDKVSLCFTVDHEVGSLYKVLAVLAAYNINLTKIQSAPIIGQPWEYCFFIDFVFGGKVSYHQAIEAIRPLTHNLKVFGAYSQGKHFEY